MDPIPSGFETDRAFRLKRNQRPDVVTWHLFEENLPTPFRKTYDDGELREWLSSYEEEVRLQDLRFIAALSDDRINGLLTWRQLEWNRSFWLIDIRVRRSTRRSGIGTGLVGRLKETCTQRGLRGIEVETQINNYPAIQFYQKNGFKVAGFNDHLYTNDDLDRQDVGLFLFWEAESH